MTRNRLLLGFGVAFAAGVVLAGYTLAGAGGALVAFGVAWAGVLLGMRLVVPDPAEPVPRTGRRRDETLDNAAYPAFRQIETALLAAGNSAGVRHQDAAAARPAGGQPGGGRARRRRGRGVAAVARPRRRTALALATPVVATVR
ncbi:MAG: hypothetical protein J2P24_21230 [Streptosporangiales bacterium]|nr:hypothetical protein [Streptosporangiales bacterium]MBO0891578.1 hypothetical protein [Acidothermales bacterium]